MILFRFMYLPQITTLSPRSHPKDLVRKKRTAQKDNIIHQRQPGEQQFPIQVVTG